MAEQTHWRLAVMFDGPGRDHTALAAVLAKAGPAIRAAAGGHSVRIGVVDEASLTAVREDAYDEAAWRTVDGAVEVSVPNAAAGEIPALCKALSAVVTPLAAPDSIQVMAGPMHFMVPVRPGNGFLSLSFRRFPGTTKDQFRNWWLNQHSGVAIPVLGNDLLAYDQVHVDVAASLAAAEAFGVPYMEYDAYDNLTFVDHAGFMRSCSDVAGMNTIFQDEIGRIDNDSRRSAFMREIG